MSNPDGVLEAIDACLDDYLSPDAMRWAPDQPEPQLSALRWAPGIMSEQEAAATVSAFADLACAAENALESFGKAFASMFGAVQSSLHRSAYSGDRAHRRRCPTCNPAGFPAGMTLDRSQYRHRSRKRHRG